MYYYVVNPSSGDRTFESIQPKLKAKLRQLDIDGEFSKTLDESDAAKITRDAISRGAQTIVAVGGDRTVNEVVTAVHESGKTSVSIGIIPTGHSNTLAQAVGATDWQQSCELLAARRLRSFRLMHINDYSFIHSCVIEPLSTIQEALIEIDGTYRLRTKVAEAELSNTRLHNPSLDDELFLQLRSEAPTLKKWQRWLKQRPQAEQSQIHARVAVIEFPQPYRAVIDGRPLESSQFRVRLSLKPIHLIAAKYKQTIIDEDKQSSSDM